MSRHQYTVQLRSLVSHWI